MLALWLPLTAFAHVPHDTVLAMAAPADGDPTVPWFVLLDPQGVNLWVRSDDAGRTWNMVGGPPLAEVLNGAGMLPDGTLLLLGDENVWWSVDQGDTWDSAPLPGDVEQLRIDGDEALVAGNGGAWIGRPDRGWTEVTTSAVRAVGPAALLLKGGQVLVHSGDWVDLPPPVEISAAAFDGAAAWVGTADGSMWRHDGDGWTTCGALPLLGDEHDEVVMIDHLSGMIAVTTGNGGPYVSEDNCQSWIDRGIPATIDYDVGGALSATDAQDVLLPMGDTWAVGGWAGIFLTNDAGMTWTVPSLVPVDYTRGVAFSPDWPERGRLYVAAYAAAILRTHDGGKSWDSPDHGISVTNAQRILVNPDDPDRLYALVNHVPWFSHDGGDTWDAINAAEGQVREILRWSEPGHLWLGGEALSESFDDGATWVERTELRESLGHERCRGLVEVGGVAWLTYWSPSGIARSDDDGATWTFSEHGAYGDVSAPTAWPADAPDRLVWGDDSGIQLYDLATDTERAVPTEAISEVTQAPDGVLFAMTLSAQLLVSEDGGESWEPRGDRLPAHVHEVVPRPDWDEHPELVVATQDGVYLVQTDGSSRRIDYSRIDDRSTFARCQGCTVDSTHPEAELDTLRRFADGAYVETWVRGTDIRILGKSEVGGGADLTIDGQGYGLFGTDEHSGELVHISGLPSGWHQVRFTGMPDVKLWFDTLEAWGPGGGLEWTSDDVATAVWGEQTHDVEEPGREKPRWGCNGHYAGLLLIPLARLRRRSGARAQ